MEGVVEEDGPMSDYGESNRGVASENKDAGDVLLVDDPLPGVRRLTMNRAEKRNSLIHPLRVVSRHGRAPAASCTEGAGGGFARVLCGGSARNRRRNQMLGEATGLRKVYPTLFSVGGDRQEGRVD